jgi:hypothetical protein
MRDGRRSLPPNLGPWVPAATILERLPIFALSGAGAGSNWRTFLSAGRGPGPRTLRRRSDAHPDGTITRFGGHHSGVVKRINTAVSRVASLLTTEVLGVVMFATFSSALDNRGAIMGLSPESKASLG